MHWMLCFPCQVSGAHSVNKSLFFMSAAICHWLPPPSFLHSPQLCRQRNFWQVEGESWTSFLLSCSERGKINTNSKWSSNWNNKKRPNTPSLFKRLISLEISALCISHFTIIVSLCLVVILRLITAFVKACVYSNLLIIHLSVLYKTCCKECPIQFKLTFCFTQLKGQNQISDWSCVLAMGCSAFLTLSRTFLSATMQLLNHTRMLVGDDAFHRAFIQGQQRFLGRIDFPQRPQKVLCFHDGPCEVLRDACSKEVDVTDPKSMTCILS